MKKDDKDRKAVAVRYSKQVGVPDVVAKGSGKVADKIVEIAKESDVAVYEDKKLVEELNKIELGDTIPPELYEVVAKILIFVGELDKKG